MTKTEKVAQRLLEPINPSLIVILGFYTVLWGLWIFCPFWTVFDHAILYSAMAGIGGVCSEYMWGTLAMIAGGFILRGAYVPSRTNLMLGAFSGALYWFVVTIMYFIGDWASTGGITSLTFGIYSALVWVNIKLNPEFYPE